MIDRREFDVAGRQHRRRAMEDGERDRKDGGGGGAREAAAGRWRRRPILHNRQCPHRMGCHTKGMRWGRRLGAGSTLDRKRLARVQRTGKMDGGGKKRRRSGRGKPIEW